MLQSGKRFRQEEDSTSDTESDVSDQLFTDDGRNAMLNDAVLSRFFEKFVDSSDLLNYRLVSTKWNSASLVWVRHEKIVKITADPSKKLNWSNFDQEFICEGVPFRCFHVCDMDFVPPPSASKVPAEYAYSTRHLSESTNTSVEKIHKNMDLFWVKYGQNIHKLKLENCRIFSLEAFNRAIFEAMPNLGELKLVDLILDNTEMRGGEEGCHQNLKCLTLSRDTGSIYNWNWSHVPFQLQRLFMYFPNLQKLKVEGIDLELALSLLKEAFESLGEIPLNELILPPLVTHANATPLRDILTLKQLKLIKLQLLLFMRDDEMTRDILQVALGKHGDTLKELTVASCESRYSYDASFGPSSNNFPFRREPLEQLTVLKLNVYVCANFQFLPLTPNLRVLHVDWRNLRIQDGYSGLGLEKVKDILRPLVYLKEFNFSVRGVREEDMKLLATMMPNVEIFKGEIGPAVLRDLCNYWRNLRRLHINRLLVKDAKEWAVELEGVKEGSVLPYLKDFRFHSRLSGQEMQVLVKVMPNVETFEGEVDTSALRVVYENWKKLREFRNRSTYIDDEDLTGIKEGVEERLPNITALQELRKLSLGCSGHVGDSSIWNGFLKLPQLRYIYVTLSKDTSHEAIHALGNQITDPSAMINLEEPKSFKEMMISELQDQLGRLAERFFENV